NSAPMGNGEDVFLGDAPIIVLHEYVSQDLAEKMMNSVRMPRKGYSQKDKNKAKTGQNQARDWKERGKPKPKAYAS
ncbi:hypothetical protein Tco_0919730, partial [Tanacetum coccineum]